MANYYKQCDCKRMTDKVPCYDCLEAENKRLREAGETLLTLIDVCVPSEIFANGNIVWGADEGEVKTKWLIKECREVIKGVEGGGE